jgi:hypothetical protein
MDSYIRTHVNRTGRWIRKHMRANKEERPEQVRLGEEIMQFLVKRETSLADAVDALTMLMLNVLARNYGKRDEFSRFYEQVCMRPRAFYGGRCRTRRLTSFLASRLPCWISWIFWEDAAVWRAGGLCVSCFERKHNAK